VLLFECLSDVLKCLYNSICWLKPKTMVLPLQLPCLVLHVGRHSIMSSSS
jgi:hypothetical protein